MVPHRAINKTAVLHCHDLVSQARKKSTEVDNIIDEVIKAGIFNI